MRRPTSCCFRILPTHAWGARALKMPSFGGAASSCFSRTLSSNEWGARVLTLPQVFPDFEEGGVAYDLPVGTQVPEEGELFEIFTDKIMVPYENLLDEPVVVAKYLVDDWNTVVKVGEPVAIVIPNVDDLPAFQAADTEGRIVIEYAEGEVPRMVVIPEGDALAEQPQKQPSEARGAAEKKERLMSPAFSPEPKPRRKRTPKACDSLSPSEELASPPLPIVATTTSSGSEKGGSAVADGAASPANLPAPMAAPPGSAGLRANVAADAGRYYSPQWGPMVVTKSPLVAKLREDQEAYIAKYGLTPTTAK